IDATTTRASTVIRSMPTSETRTHASMTMPLSRTRSRTSTRLVPPAARSTGIHAPPVQRRSPCRGSAGAAPYALTGSSRRVGQLAHLRFQPPDLFTELLVFAGHSPSGGEVTVVRPPVEPHGLGLIEGANDQPD